MEYVFHPCIAGLQAINKKKSNASHAHDVLKMIMLQWKMLPCFKGGSDRGQGMHLAFLIQRCGRHDMEFEFDMIV